MLVYQRVTASKSFTIGYLLETVPLYHSHHGTRGDLQTLREVGNAIWTWASGDLLSYCMLVEVIKNEVNTIKVYGRYMVDIW